MVEERCEQQGTGSSLSDARRLSELREEVELLKHSLVELVQKKKAIAAAMTRVVEERLRVSLRKRAYEESKQRLRTEYEELQQVASSNQRRDDRLARVRGKDFSKKLEEMERKCDERKREVEKKRERLQETRRESVVALQNFVFPITVEPLSQDDAGEEDYQLSAEIDCDTAMDVDDGWVLSGVHRSPTPHASIISASLPLNGDYSPYLEAAEERRKKLKAATETGAPLPPVTVPGLHPLVQPYLAVPAGLQFTAQLVEVAADILDTPLPHPLHRPLSIMVYGNQNKKRRLFVESRAKLDDNIIYLCFSQNVPVSALSSGHTLSNLLALVTHSELGRPGAFTCQPDLATYTGDDAGLAAGDPEEEPPSLCTAADQPEESDEGEEGEEGEGGEEEWASVEVRSGEERGRLEYQSGYLDFMSLGASREAEGEEGKTVGLFATISSLFSSTFTSQTNS